MELEIWKYIDEFNTANLIDSDKDIKCKHVNNFLVNSCITCYDCGEILNTPFEDCEWNNFKNEDGSYQKSTQRMDVYCSDNPYSKLGAAPTFNKNSLIMRIHYQQTFSHKQKTFWKTSEKFLDYAVILGIPKNTIDVAKNMWHICMESGKLTRAGVRKGLIASCLYYACVSTNIPREREDIINTVEGDNKDFLKGEKIFVEIMEQSDKYKNIIKERIDIKNNDTFFHFCHVLEIPLEASKICDDIYSKNKERLDSVTPKSATAGILMFVVKNILRLKKPTKNKISSEVNVCIPTINKVLTILEK